MRDTGLVFGALSERQGQLQGLIRNSGIVFHTTAVRNRDLEATFRALPTFRGDSQFGTWAHRIAVNRTLNALRRTRRLAAVEVDVEDDSASVEPEAERAILAASIEEAAAKLSPGARTVFLLHDVEGYTHEEIATQLGITAGGSKSQLFKARAKLRTLLAHLIEAPTSALRPTNAEHAAPLY